MDEANVRELLNELYVHVAAMPWKDKEFSRNLAHQAAAQDQIVSHITDKIMELHEDAKETVD